MRVRLDEETLKTIANITRADYFYAGTAADLKKVYQGLSSRLVVEKKETEITALFALAGHCWWCSRRGCRCGGSAGSLDAKKPTARGRAGLTSPFALA